MSIKDDMTAKFFDYSKSPSTLFTIFNSHFKPMLEVSTANRLSNKKLNQAYTPLLSNIIKHSLQELSKKSSSKFQDYLIELLNSSLMHLSKICVFSAEETQEFYNYCYSFACKLNELSRYEECLSVYKKISEDLDLTELFQIRINFYLLVSNVLLSSNALNIKILEQVYDFIAIKCRNLLFEHKKIFDGHGLNKVYNNSFRLLMKTGKILDNIAAGNLTLHEQALMIRTTSLNFLSKTKPLIISDYIAFAYSSVLGSYKFACSLNLKNLFLACVSAIEESILPVDLNSDIDKNLRSMLELKAVVLSKIEKPSKIKSTLMPLLYNSDDLIGLLSDIKYYLEIVRAQFNGKLEIIADLEILYSKLHLLFEVKLTAPSVIKTGELTEIKELSPKVLTQFDNWIKVIASTHNPSSVKTGLAVPVSTLKLMVDVGKYFGKMVRFQEKLDVPVQVDSSIFNYSMILNYSLLYMNTKDPAVFNQLLSSAAQFPQKSSIKFLFNVYNLLINIIQAGEKEAALKIGFVIIENSQTMHQNLVPILEMLAKYSGDDTNTLKHCKKVMTGLLFRLSNEEKIQELGLKLVEVLIYVQCKAIKQGDRTFVLDEIDLDGKLLEKEADVLLKRILIDGDYDGVLFERIQIIARNLLFKVYKPCSSEQVEFIIWYFQALGTLAPDLKEEKIVNEVFELISNEKVNCFKQKLLVIIKYFYKYHKLPVLVLWKCLVFMEIIRENEKSTQGLWISRDGLKIYMKIYKNLEKLLSIYSNNFKITIKSDLTVKKSNAQIQISEIDAKTLNLATEICKLFSLHQLEYSFLTIFEEFTTDLLAKDCLEVRKKIALYHLGISKEIYFSLPLQELNSDKDFFCNGWKIALYGEFLFYSGKLEKSQVLLTNLIKSITQSHLGYKRGQLLKAYSLLILSQISLIQGNYCGSLSLCNEGRSMLKEKSIYSHCIHNLSVFNTISDYSNKSLIVYPNTCWSFQSISISLTHHLAEVYIHLSMIPNSIILFTHNLKLSKVLASPNLFLLSSSKICMIHRQTSIGIFNDNIKETNFVTIQPVEFAEGVFTSVFEVLMIDYEKFKERKIVEVLDSNDIDCLGKIIDKESLCNALITLGDILQTPVYYQMIDLQAAEQNYYRLAKYLLGSSMTSIKFSILRSLIYRKLALLNYKQFPKKYPIKDLENSLLQVACCKNFLEKDCCGNKISPLVHEELCFSILNLCSFLLEQGEDFKPYLRYLMTSTNIAHPIILNQSHFLLGLDSNQCKYQRTFHTLSSIGTSYNTQAFLPQFSDHDEMFLALQDVPEGLTIVGFSVGRNPSKYGSLVCRYEKGKEPVCIQSNNMCCTGHENLNLYIEEFSKIMQEAGKTSTQERIIRVNSGQWWETRERLDEKLKKLLENMQDKYLGILACLFIGRINDENIDRMVYLTAKDIFPDFKCECGEKWNFQILYCLFTSFICNQLTTENLSSIISSSIFSRYQEEILKKAKSLKRSCSSKPIIQNPVTLLISGHLLHFPWESMKIFFNTYVTRCLSLRLFLKSLPIPKPNYKSGFFILNPSNDLDSTQKTFQNFFSSHTSWTGINKEAPSESAFKEALTSKDLLIYCGHSSGEQYLRGDKVRELNVRAATFLFGCSSGLLKSQGFYEPQGIAVSYMIAHCPGLLANLWDVTDKDIDRFAMEMIKKIEVGCSVGVAITAARNACKLKYLVGAAPVWYGVPLEFQLC